MHKLGDAPLSHAKRREFSALADHLLSRTFLRFPRGQDISSSYQRTADAICHAFPVKDYDIRGTISPRRVDLDARIKTDNSEGKLVRTRVNDEERNESFTFSSR